ncbi:unnamed protein product, partial [Allacma fusca]
FKVGPRL